jgi:hypothetical protein
VVGGVTLAATLFATFLGHCRPTSLSLSATSFSDAIVVVDQCVTVRYDCVEEWVAQRGWMAGTASRRAIHD